MLHTKTKLLGLCIVLLSSLFHISPVFAELEEITVTAERRETSVQDIPIAITAFNQDQLDRMQITETLDLVKVIPNMIGSNNTGLGTANSYSIRGLNNTESIATFDPPVGSYINDSFVQRQNANNFTLFDVDRVEVLRGPQGTLFGRNTTGGAVRVVLKDPSEECTGFVEAGVGAYDEVNFRGSIDLPVNENIRTKVSAYAVSDDGYVDVTQPGNEDLNYEDSWGLRAAVQIDFNENQRWDASVAYNDNEHANVFNNEVDGNRVSFSALQDAGFAGILTGDKANLPGNFNGTKSTLISSDLEIDTGIGVINFITNFLTLDHEFNLDFFELEGVPLPTGLFSIANIGEHDQVTQEIRLTSSSGDKFEYVAGIYYFDEENTTDFGTYNFFPVFSGNPPSVADRIMTNSTESIAIYAQGDYHMSDKATITLGARYTDEEKTIGYEDNTGGLLTTDEIELAGVPTKQSETKVTPRIALNYNLNDDLSMYASVTRGFKSGGWNARSTTPAQVLPFGPETATNYEIGMKSEWADNSLRLNVSAFLNDVEDFQLPSAFSPPGGGIIFITQNFADLEVSGLEVELMWQPTDAFTLFANIGTQDSKYQNIAPGVLNQQADCLNLVNAAVTCSNSIVTADGSIATPVRAPETSLAVGLNYAFQFSNGMSLIPSVIYSDTGDHAIGTDNDFGDSVNYSNVNAGITLIGADDKWSVNLGCTNCTNEVQEVSDLVGKIYLNEPERWNLRGRINF